MDALRPLLALLAVLPLCAAAPHPDPEAAAAYLKVQSSFIDLDLARTRPAAGEAELGKKLFFDPRLAANKAMSCSTCHHPGMAWTDGLRKARGIHHQELGRNTPSLFTIHRNIPHPYFWDGRALTLEEAIRTALENRLEMSRDLTELVFDLERIPGYAREFAAVYGPGGVSGERVVRALSAFVRAEVRLGQTPFDRFGKDPSALDEKQRLGLKTFVDKGRCLFCHNTPFFSDDFFHNVGVRKDPSFPDRGRHAVVPDDPRFSRAFRTPPLRNSALTGPYMHDGSLATLRDVVEFYDRGGDEPEDRDEIIKPLGLTQAEKDGLVAFLEALSSPQIAMQAPILPPAGGPDTAEEGRDLLRLRLDALEHAAKNKDRDGVRARALILAEESARLPGLVMDARCAASLKAGAEALSRAARPPGESPSEVARRAQALRKSTLACASPAAAAAPSPAPGGPCAPGATVTSLLSDLARGSLGPGATEQVWIPFHERVLFHYEYRCLIQDSPAPCDELKGLRKVYFGVSVPADEACRERYYENTTVRAFVADSPDYFKRCVLSVLHSYQGIPRPEAEASCRILDENKKDPGRACDQLVPRYLNLEKKESCLNLLSRLMPRGEESVCEALVGGPVAWLNRCKSIVMYGPALRKNDPEICGDRRLCRAMIADAPKSVDESGKEILEAACAAVKSLRQ